VKSCIAAGICSPDNAIGVRQRNGAQWEKKGKKTPFSSCFLETPFASIAYPLRLFSGQASQAIEAQILAAMRA
jgi:hypothetical protein